MLLFRPRLIFSVRVLILFSLCLLTTRNLAHEAPSGWEYYGPCCGGTDCRAVADEEVEAIFAGESYFDIQKQEDVVVEEAGFIVRGRFIPHHRVMISPDDSYHFCTNVGPRSNEWSRVYSAHDLRLAGQAPPDFQFCRHIDLTDLGRGTAFGSGRMMDSMNNHPSAVNDLHHGESSRGLFGDLIEEMDRQEQSSEIDRSFHCIWVPREACEEALRDGQAKRSRQAMARLNQDLRSSMARGSVEQRMFAGLIYGGASQRRTTGENTPIFVIPEEDLPPLIEPPGGSNPELVAPIPLGSSGIYLGAIVIGGAILFKFGAVPLIGLAAVAAGFAWLLY